MGARFQLYPLSHIQEENAMINYRKNLMLAVNSGNSEYLKRVNN